MHRFSRNALVIVAFIAFMAMASGARAADSIGKQLNDAYLRDSNETVQMAQRLLQHPERLGATDATAAHSYLCEALSDLGRYDDALVHARVGAATVPAKSKDSDQVEYAARLLSCAGYAAKQKQRFTEAMAYFDRAIALVDSNRAAIPASADGPVIAQSYALYRRAGTYDTLGDHAAALADLTRALRMLPDDPGDTDVAAQRMNITSAIGHLHLGRQEYADAARSYESVLQSARKTGDEHAEAIIQTRLGECYRGLQRWSDAQQAYARAVEIATKLKDQGLLGRSHAGLGALARARKDYAGAVSNLSLAHTELAAAQLPLEIANADLERAEAMADVRDWQGLATLAGQLVATFTTIGDKRLLVRAIDLRARAAEGNGDPAAALADTRREVALQDGIQRAELADELARRNVEFEVAQLDDRARLLERENELANLQIRHDRDIDLAQRAAITIAVGIVLLLAFSIHRRIRIQRLLTKLALEDALTGLRNRRAALAAAGELFATSRHAATPFSLALLDIDHFKRINDTWGHAAGDAVLVAVATCMRESLRTDDICGRVGGEEFLFVFPRCDLDHAAKLLEDIRAAIAALHIAGLPDDFRVALSAGLTGRHGDDAQLDVLVRRADVALYAAKNAGRNRVVVDRD